MTVWLLAGIQSAQKISNSILEKKWPRNELDEEDDPYEALALAYNKEKDPLVKANTNTNEVEKEDSTTCTNAKMMELDDKEEEA